MVKDKIYPNYTDNYYYYEGNNFIELIRYRGNKRIYSNLLEFDSVELAKNYFDNLYNE